MVINFRPTGAGVVAIRNREPACGTAPFPLGQLQGGIWPINPKYNDVAGHRCYKDAGRADLGFIMTPPDTVPGIIAKFGTKGCPATVIITAG